MAEIDPETPVERLRKANPKRERDKGIAGRIPPGQFLREKFPVLTEGPTPKIDLGQWRLKISGLVENPFELTWEEFTALPRKTLTTDLHCVTRWSMLDSVWEGVPFADSTATPGARSDSGERGDPGRPS